MMFHSCIDVLLYRRQLQARLGLLAFFANAFIAASLAQCTTNSETSKWPTVPIHVVASQPLTLIANPNDINGAFKIWGELAGCRLHLNVETHVEVLASVREFRQRLAEGRVSLLILDSMQFVKLSGAGLVEGLAVTSKDKAPYAYTFLLLVDRQTDSLAQLRSRSAIFYLRTSSAASLAWTETLLAGEHLGRVESFFGPSEVATKPSNCVLPLFFGRVQACVISSVEWELMKEMNPQLGVRLRVLAESRPLVESVIAMPKGPVAHRQEIADTLLNDSNNPAAQQIYTLFKTGPLIPFKPEYLDSTRALWEEYARILPPAERLSHGDSERFIIPKSFQGSAEYQPGQTGSH